MFERDNLNENNNEIGPAGSSKAAFNDKLKELREALDILYISNNASGRRKFCKKWPQISEYIFGSKLIEYDTEGVHAQERELRVELEDKANERRIEFKKTIDDSLVNSVDSGSLKFDYVGSVIDKYGVIVSGYIYDKSIIERVRPSALALYDASKKEAEEQQKREDNLIVELRHNAHQDVFIGSKQHDNGSSPVFSSGVLYEEPVVKTDALGHPDTEDDNMLSEEEKTILSNKQEGMHIAVDAPYDIDSIRPINVNDETVPDQGVDAVESIVTDIHISDVQAEPEGITPWLEDVVKEDVAVVMVEEKILISAPECPLMDSGLIAPAQVIEELAVMSQDMPIIQDVPIMDESPEPQEYAFEDQPPEVVKSVGVETTISGLQSVSDDIVSRMHDVVDEDRPVVVDRILPLQEDELRKELSYILEQGPVTKRPDLQQGLQQNPQEQHQDPHIEGEQISNEDHNMVFKVRISKDDDFFPEMGASSGVVNKAGAQNTAFGDGAGENKNENEKDTDLFKGYPDDLSDQ